MLPIRPYLLEAFYHWIVDSGLTPYVVVRIDIPGVHAPKEYAFNEELTVDVSPSLVDNIQINGKALTCTAYFDEGPFELVFPMGAITSIFAYENQEGVNFTAEDFPESLNNLLSQEPASKDSEARAGQKPVFSLIKDD